LFFQRYEVPGSTFSFSDYEIKMVKKELIYPKRNSPLYQSPNNQAAVLLPFANDSKGRTAASRPPSG